jgi:general secretion pathway protein G
LYKARADVRALEAALNLFVDDFGRCPSREEGLAVLIEPTSVLSESERYPVGGYLGRLPQDPWGNDYHYRCPGTHNSASFDVWSIGSDGQQGGAVQADEIGNWPRAYERLLAEERRNNLLYGIAFAALIGFVVGLPLYVVGVGIKLWRGSTFLAALKGFHLGAQLYLTFLAPLVVFLIALIASPGVY